MPMTALYINPRRAPVPVTHTPLLKQLRLPPANKQTEAGKLQP